MTIKSLGKMLKDQIEEQERQRQSAKQAAAEAEAREFAREMAVIVDYFQEVQQGFTTSIMNGEKPGHYSFGSNRRHQAEPREVSTILKTYESDFESKMKNGKHQFAKPYLDLVEWGVQNGLVVSMTYEHDGMGTDSWYTLSVKPSEEI